MVDAARRVGARIEKIENDLRSGKMIRVVGDDRGVGTICLGSMLGNLRCTGLIEDNRAG
jgi:hypothetical protein